MDKEDKHFNNDPIFIKNLIGKNVSIETIDNQCHSGIIYVIDPIFKTIVLFNESSKIVLITHKSIKSFHINTDEVNKNYLNNNISNNINDIDCLEKKHRLIKWLKKMYINVKEEGDYLKIEEHLRIGPPYGIDNCMCDNTIILKRITNIIDAMPLHLD